MAKWHRGGAERSWLRHAARDAKSSDKGREGGSCTNKVVDECRNEMINLVAGYRSY